MEPRIAKLEASVEHLRADMVDVKSGLKKLNDSASDVRERLAVVETKLGDLPTKGFIVTTGVVGLGVIAALLGYADQVQALLGNAPPQP